MFNRLFLPLIFLATTLFFAYPMGDADFGWHLKYGETMLAEQRIIRTNEFSWLLPGYSWANHSWGYDILLSLIFNHSRFWLTSLTAGLIIAVSLILTLPKAKPLSILAGIGLFWYFGTALMTVGLRSQLLSLLATAILWKLIRQNKVGWYLPLLFLVWSNLHGQFIVGLGLLGFWLLPQKRFDVFIVSALATLINPFGVHLWTTAIAHFNAPTLGYIYEWMPWELFSPKMLGLILITSYFWWKLIHQHLPLTQKLSLTVITLLALTSRRMIPYYLIMILPLLISSLDSLLPKKSSWLVLILLFIGLMQFNRHQIFAQSWDSYCNTNVMCSENMTRYLNTHPLEGKLFNSYRLGGYLIYRTPGIKPMIDGRMTVWHDPSGIYPFATYSDIVYSKPGSFQLFQQLDPDYVLIHSQYTVFTKNLIDLAGWQLLYRDKDLLLLQKP